MAITYPLTPPASPNPSAVTWSETNVTIASSSTFSLERQIQVLGGQGWSIDVDFDPLTREEAAPWIAFLSSLKGPLGTFYFGDTLWATPRGTATGSPKVKGAGQTGAALVTDGWTPTTSTLKAADMIQIDTCLYRNLTDATANGSGEMTLDVWPDIRGHADNATIVTAAPKGLFRLVASTVTTQEAGRSALWTITFSAVEAL